MSAPNVSSTITVIRPIAILIAGQSGASAAAVATVRMPQKCQVVAVSAIARAKGGTHGTTTLDAKNGSTSIVSAVLDLNVAAGTRVDGTVVKNTGDLGSVFDKDDELVIDLVMSGGSSPTLDDITVQVDVAPL